MDDKMSNYSAFLEITKKLHTLDSIGSLLGWDQDVMLTPGGVALRSEQMALVSSLHHELLTSSALGDVLAQLREPAAYDTLDETQKVNVDDLWRQYSRATKIPARLVRELSKATSKANQVWREAREKSDFALFAPHLKKIVELVREYAKLIDPDKNPYENLLHDYEPHLSLDEVKTILHDIKEKLKPRIQQWKGHANQDILQTDVAEDVQFSTNKEVATLLGFDFENGRLDTSTHPFTAHPADVRITTRFSEGWWDSLSALIHETGHGLYDQGLPQEHMGTPRGDSCFLSIHESQSRLYENHVGLGKSFWQFYFPKLKDTYKLDCSFDEFYRAINAVNPSFIRVQADEVTYPMHIVLRVEIEEALINGEIEVDDLPKIWNQKMQDLLGITPKNDREGVLQDVHWSFGGFGYFATYVLGSVIAAQLYEKIEQDIPGLEQDLASGKTDKLLSWLREHIHSQGRRFESHKLVEQATGKLLSADAYLKYFDNKYGELYGEK